MSFIIRKFIEAGSMEKALFPERLAMITEHDKNLIEYYES